MRDGKVFNEVVKLEVEEDKDKLDDSGNSPMKHTSQKSDRRTDRQGANIK